MNVAVRGPGGRDVEIPIEDRFGKICMLKLHLTEVAFEDAPAELTHSVLQLVVYKLAEVGTVEGHGSRAESHLLGLARRRAGGGIRVAGGCVRPSREGAGQGCAMASGAPR